jgi:hypothetical protein
MAYDPKQLDKDLGLIVRKFGKRTPHGFYTIGVYEDLLIKIVDPYVGEKQLFSKYNSSRHDEVSKDKLLPDSQVGLHVLRLVMAAEVG